MGTVWTDAGREDPCSPEPGQKRQLAVWIWYPASAGDGTGAAEYLPAAWRRAFAEHAGVLLAHVLSPNRKPVRAHSLDGAAVAREGAPYPVVIFRSGIGAPALGPFLQWRHGRAVLPCGRALPRGVDLDGAPYGSVVREGVSQLFLFLLSDHGDAWGSAD
jgi:hypothetical protein